jgi:hypothetical protein
MKGWTGKILKFVSSIATMFNHRWSLCGNSETCHLNDISTHWVATEFVLTHVRDNNH